MADVLAVKYLLLAEHVEAVNGKHYIMGGGLDQIRLPSIPAALARAGVALAVEVPYAATATPHKITVDIVDGDERSVLGQVISAPFETGRPPGMRAGDHLNVLLAFNIQNLQFGAAGNYSVKVEIDGSEAKRERFSVQQGVVLGPMAPPPAEG